MHKPYSEDLPPDPFSFIKSIAEQGYSLSTALADLIDNSVTAGATRVEILSDDSNNVFSIYIADNGKGMSELALHGNMRFPSNNPDNLRTENDLGRFGLGMKTASFSQSSKFTVISRVEGTKDYYARTWDVDYLHKTGSWSLIINNQDEIIGLLQKFLRLSKEDYFGFDVNFLPNTIIVWSGLYKIERLKQDLSFKKKALLDELTDDSSEHIGLVFHKYLETLPTAFSIRINNHLVAPFNPFPMEKDVRRLQPYERIQDKDSISIQGYILPARSIKESKESNSIWTFGKRSLTDMEGIYVYRNNRLIVYGGWNRLIKKSPQFQLGRLKVEIGNSLDYLFHLNVSKSSLKIPFEFKQTFLRAVVEIRDDAIKEYRNRITNEVISKEKGGKIPLINKVATAKGFEFKLNPHFPLVNELLHSIKGKENKIFNDLIKKINLKIMEILGYDENHDHSILVAEVSEDLVDDVKFYSDLYKQRGYDEKRIKEVLISLFGRETINQIL